MCLPGLDRGEMNGSSRGLSGQPQGSMYNKIAANVSQCHLFKSIPRVDLMRKSQPHAYLHDQGNAKFQ